MLFETGLNQWTVTTGDEAVILSEYRLDGEVGVRLSSALSEFVEVSEQGRDGDFYYYHFKKDDACLLYTSKSYIMCVIYIVCEKNENTGLPGMLND